MHNVSNQVEVDRRQQWKSPIKLIGGVEQVSKICLLYTSDAADE